MKDKAKQCDWNICTWRLSYSLFGGWWCFWFRIFNIYFRLFNERLMLSFSVIWRIFRFFHAKKRVQTFSSENDLFMQLNVSWKMKPNMNITHSMQFKAYEICMRAWQTSFSSFEINKHIELILNNLISIRLLFFLSLWMSVLLTNEITFSDW